MRRYLRTGVRVIVALAAATAVGGSVVANSTQTESAVIVAQSLPPPPPTLSTRPTKVRKGPFALILVIDAARFDEVNLAQMPNLARLVAGGTEYSNAWVGQLPSVTESSHATIGTGVLPARHGILGDTWRVPGKSQMTPNLLNGQLDRTGYIGKVMKAANVPSLAAMVHRGFPGSVVATMSGHKIYAADAMGAGAADFVAFGIKDSRGHFVPSAIPGHEPSKAILSSPQLDLPTYPRQPGVEDTWTTTLAEKFLFKYHPRVMMVNFPEVDVFGHIAGTNAAVMQPLMANMDHQIGRLLAAYGRAGLLSQTYFVVTADHAMVPGTHTISSGLIEQIIHLAGGQPLYVGHGDSSSIWLKNPVAIPRVAAALANANIPDVAAVYARNTSGRYTLVSPVSRLADPAVQQSYADLVNSFDNATSPDIVLLYDENTITMTPSFIKSGRKGDHGGASWGAQHIPLVLAGPGVRQSYVSDYPARLVDIAPTVETLLGLQPKGQDGVPLADAMLSPPAWAVSAQNQESSRMLDDASGLEREAADRPNTR